MNAIIPIVLVSILVIPIAVMIFCAFFVKTKDEIEFERMEQAQREVQEYLDNKYKKDYAKCRTQEDYDKLERAVERGDYIAPSLFS